MLKRMVSMAMESKDGGVALASALLAEEIRNANNQESMFGLSIGLLKATL